MYGELFRFNHAPWEYSEIPTDLVTIDIIIVLGALGICQNIIAIFAVSCFTNIFSLQNSCIIQYHFYELSSQCCHVAAFETLTVMLLLCKV